MTTRATDSSGDQREREGGEGRTGKRVISVSDPWIYSKCFLRDTPALLLFFTTRSSQFFSLLCAKWILYGCRRRRKFFSSSSSLWSGTFPLPILLLLLLLLLFLLLVFPSRSRWPIKTVFIITNIFVENCEEINWINNNHHHNHHQGENNRKEKWEGDGEMGKCNGKWNPRYCRKER